VANLRCMSLKGTSLLTIAATALFAMSAAAQSVTDKCGLAHVIPLTTPEPPAKIVADPPLAGPLASRGVVVIQYCVQNIHLAPVFGAGATVASPRVGHLHVSLDDAPWVWMDASGNPIIIQGLPPGPHKVLLQLEDANHHTLDQATVSFAVPGNAESTPHH
jgi:uncharacterized protein DUF6130